ncbi:cell division cycle protein 27 homolog B-like isoform X1 [Zingiber officinale]|uniref:cell division cycle protein 27 homolog B-like isoform X1 n=1 Tax=Zingiber officinale TaxID=94328 RepID=UPI001C4C9DAE|nr:cell division cycle protein 27 homolog B-like isoform X1 [Zingiber officinale]
METLMVDSVQNSLRLFMHRNAIFFCERLCAEFPTELNLQLLATCYLQNGKAYCAYQILKGTSMPHSRYLFAMSCFQMNLLQEAEAALCPANEPNAEVPDGAAGHYLLGLIYRYIGRRGIAIEHLMQALAIDPLLWAAYDELCVLGAVEDTNEYFSDMAAQHIQKQYLSESNSLNSSNGSEFNNGSSNMSVIFVDSIPRQSKQLLANNAREISSIPPSSAIAKVPASNSGTSNFSQFITPPAATQLSGVAPPPLCRNVHVSFNVANNDIATKSNNIAVQTPRRKLLDEGKLRKVSGRLFSDSVPRRSTRLSTEAIAVASSNATQITSNGNSHTSAKFLGGFSSSSSSKVNAASSRSLTFKKGHSWISESFDEGRRSEDFDDSRMENMATTSSYTSMSGDVRYLEQGKTIGDLAQDSRLISGAQELLCLLRTLGEGYWLSCSYRCQEALEVFLKLSEKQFNTGWVLSQVGRLHFELVDYYEADHFFSLARRVSPFILEGMDMYSTALYHMKEEMKLSYLAQELISVDRLSPQAWCALGNCYSMQKDHETALKIFQRAVQLDSRFVYAHTLCGHEYIALEDFENGIKCYQSALQIDQRHYNSWYGLGVVYLRQEKFEFAEHHLRKAYNINPQSSVLMCYLGMAQHALQRNEDALEMLERAIAADKQNPLPVYQKANILSLDRFDEALNVLEQLKESAPHESCVYALMGKIYKRLEMHEKAMFYFGLALDLKPPAADVATIKAAMEKLYLPDEMDDIL